MTSIKQNNNNKNNKSSNTYPNASSVCKVPFVTFMIMTTTGMRYFKRAYLKANILVTIVSSDVTTNITPNIKWIKAPREDYDCLDDGVKLVAHEVKFYFSGQIQRTSLGNLIPVSSLKSVVLLFWTFTRWRCRGSSAKSKNRLTSASDLAAGFFLILCFYFLVFYGHRLVSNNTDCLTTDIPTEVCLSLSIG